MHNFKLNTSLIIIKKILIAIGGGVLSEKTARAGYELAKATSAEIALVNIVDPEIVVGEGGYTATGLINISKQEGKEILEIFVRTGCFLHNRLS